MFERNFMRSNSPDETAELAQKLASQYPKALVLLSGSLGAGKTLFAKGFAAGLGIASNVSSPSYTLINEYKGSFSSMFHLDLYRLNCFEEVVDIGLFDVLEAGEPCLIEWAERVEELEKLPHLAVEILLGDNHENNNEIRDIYWQWKETEK